VGSQLFPKASTGSGQIGCEVQWSNNLRSWVITGFDDIPANTFIRIYGIIDIPVDTSLTTGIADITTYGGYDAASNYNNANIVDRMAYKYVTSPLVPVPMNQLSINSYKSMDVEGF
jgi:hypothetical protein